MIEKFIEWKQKLFNKPTIVLLSIKLTLKSMLTKKGKVAARKLYRRIGNQFENQDY